MKVISSKQLIMTAFSRIQSIVEKSSIMPITANALVTTRNNQLTVSATNLEIGMIASYPNVQVKKEGTISVNAKKFYEIIRELPEEDITIEEKENFHIEIICKKVKFNILGLPPEDFPLFFQHDSVKEVNWETEKIKKMIDYTSFSISTDESRLNITGAFVEKLENNNIRMVTTDGYRLSLIDELLGENVPFEGGILISNKAISELKKIITDKKDEQILKVKLIKNNLYAKIGEVELFIRLIEKKFPEYKYIIPPSGDNEVTVKAEKETIRPALKRMSIIANENKRPVVFTFKDMLVDIATEDNELGSVNEIVELSEPMKKSFSFSINGRYLLDVLNAVEDDINIEVNIKDKNKPIIIHPVSKNNTTYIIMPMLSE